MRLPLRWLKEYVDFNVTPEEFVEKLMWRGFEVAEIIDEMPNIKNVVVCTIKSIESHPDAKKLRVCQVDIGEDELVQIVTNSTLVKVGAQVPVALCGAVLADGFEIKPAKLRGVESLGMFCGGKEIGLTDADYEGASRDEVLILNEVHPNGQRVQEAFDLDSIVFDIELTPNRADCQSVIGMCREAAAALGQKFVEPEIKYVDGTGDVSEYAQVTVMNTELCSRYCARVVTDLRIEPSPAWMKKKLRSVGLRPINNIVDITNLVLVEYGQPMHAFDLSCVSDGHIVVRNATEGEKVVTLDSKERIMSEDMLLIADPNKGVGIAGVMGGENSEITSETKATLFESAVFKGSNIRATTKKLHHVTDSAARFIKGVEPVNAMLALNRAIELVEMLGAGRVVGGMIDVCNADIVERTITVDADHINKLIGLKLTPQYMAELLETINIATCVESNKLIVNVPHYRVDIESGIESDWDIAEEVARLHGYYHIPCTLMSGDVFLGKNEKSFCFDDKIKDTLVALGLCEIYSYNFISPSDIEALKLSADDERTKAVELLNPFGKDQSLMRTTLIPSLLKNLSLNYNRKSGYGRFFELGNVHIDNEVLPKEKKMLGISCMLNGESFFTMKGIIEELLDRLGIENVVYTQGKDNYLQPGQRADIYVSGERIGRFGTVHPDLLKFYDMGTKAYVAELDVNKLMAVANATRTYKALPKFPVVNRDIAVVVDESRTCSEITSVIKNTETETIVDDIMLFDVYRGAGIGDGKKSMAFSFTLRAEDHTLSDAEIQGAVRNIIEGLENKLGAKLR